MPVRKCNFFLRDQFSFNLQVIIISSISNDGCLNFFFIKITKKIFLAFDYDDVEGSQVDIITHTPILVTKKIHLFCQNQIPTSHFINSLFGPTYNSVADLLTVH